MSPGLRADTEKVVVVSILLMGLINVSMGAVWVVDKRFGVVACLVL
jgi:hypothetical protein